MRMTLNLKAQANIAKQQGFESLAVWDHSATRGNGFDEYYRIYRLSDLLLIEESAAKVGALSGKYGKTITYGDMMKLKKQR